MFQFPAVRSLPPIHSAAGDWVLPQPSFLIQKSPDQRLFASFPELIAGYHVFRRLSMPRHPPYTLSSLTTFIDHRRHGQARGSARRAKLSRDQWVDSPKKVLDDARPRQKDSSAPGKEDLGKFRGGHRGRSCAAYIRPGTINLFEPHVFTCQRASSTADRHCYLPDAPHECRRDRRRFYSTGPCFSNSNATITQQRSKRRILRAAVCTWRPL